MPRRTARREAGRKAVIVLTDAVDDRQPAPSAGRDRSGTTRRRGDPRAADFRSRRLWLRRASAIPGRAWRKKMADDTGGRVIDVHNSKSLEKAFDEISEELRSQYVLGYYPTNTKRDGTFRKIQVEVNGRTPRCWRGRDITRLGTHADAIASTCGASPTRALFGRGSSRQRVGRNSLCACER